MLAKAIIALASVFNYNRKHIYSTGLIYDRHLRSSKYVYNTGHWTEAQNRESKLTVLCLLIIIVLISSIIIYFNIIKLLNY